MTTSAGDLWSLPFTALMRAGAAAWVEYAKAYSVETHARTGVAEPAWTSANSIRLELESMRLREFSRGGDGLPTLIVAPFALHGAVLADLAPGHSIIERLLAEKISPLLLLECKTAQPHMQFFSIDTYVADLNVIIDDLGGCVNCVGLCQGGWLSLIYAARFPGKVNSLVLAGSPIDVDASPSYFVRTARQTDLRIFEQIVASGEGRVLGPAVLDFWGITDLNMAAVADILQTQPSAQLFARFQVWYNWIIDLPGTFYLQVVRHLFRDNRLATSDFEALGQRIDLARLRMPLFLLAGETDEVAPPEQVLNTRNLVRTPRELIVLATAPCGHLSLFLGKETIAHDWRRIGEWLRARQKVSARRRQMRDRERPRAQA